MRGNTVFARFQLSRFTRQTGGDFENGNAFQQSVFFQTKGNPPQIVAFFNQDNGRFRRIVLFVKQRIVTEDASARQQNGEQNQQFQ